LAIAAIVSVLALTSHPAGIATVAPLVATLPAAAQWLRKSGLTSAVAAAAVAIAAIALAITSATLDSDLETRVGLARIARSNGAHDEPFWHEYLRYTQFDANGGDTAVRHLSVGLLWFAVLAFLLRGQTGARLPSFLPTRALVAGLGLFALIPSKWPWHFGVLLGLGAVAFATEAARLHERHASFDRRGTRPLALLLTSVGLVLWSWNATGDWSPLDLHKSMWSGAFGFRGAGLFLLALIFWAAFVPTLARRLGWSQPPSAPTSLAIRLTIVGCYAAIATTLAMFATDAIRSEWTIARQNLSALVGSHACGLVNQFNSSDDRLRPLAHGGVPSLVAPEFALDFPCSLAPRPDRGLTQIPAVVVAGDMSLVREPAAPFSAISDLYTLTPVHVGPGLMVTYAVDRILPGYVRTSVDRSS
jgi:hypothetical protein